MKSPQRAPAVVITGMGIVSCFGIGAQAVQAGLATSPPARRETPSEAPPQVRDARAACPFQLDHHLAFRSVGYVSRLTELSLLGAHLALADAELAPPAMDAPRLGIIYASAHGDPISRERGWRELLEQGPQKLSPIVIPEALTSNMHPGVVAIHFGLQGVMCTLSMGEAGGLGAVAYALESLRGRRADALLACGADCLSDSLFDYYAAALGMLGGGQTDIPLGEGCVSLLLEREEQAVARRARVYARCAGYGLSGDPGSSGLLRAMRMALRDARLAPDAIQLICLNENGTLLDEQEQEALRQLFGAGRLPPSIALKRWTGETCAMGGSLNAAYGALWLAGSAPPPGAPASSSQRPPACLALASSFEGMHAAVVLQG
ncbi:MAG: hypothetical protein HYY96_17575 [Candidatus Tectomicrobia bacterium]|nr:hypothetical protein [Candidatus Tectomicrobia bacterium]